MFSVPQETLAIVPKNGLARKYIPAQNATFALVDSDAGQENKSMIDTPIPMPPAKTHGRAFPNLVLVLSTIIPIIISVTPSVIFVIMRIIATAPIEIPTVSV